MSRSPRRKATHFCNQKGSLPPTSDVAGRACGRGRPSPSIVRSRPWPSGMPEARAYSPSYSPESSALTAVRDIFGVRESLRPCVRIGPEASVAVSENYAHSDGEKTTQTPRCLPHGAVDPEAKRSRGGRSQPCYLYRWLDAGPKGWV